MLVSGSVAQKAAHLVADAEPVVVTNAPRFVGRGGLKLEGALQRTGVEVRGQRVLDLGSSTGGFSDCALQGGALSVVCVDVGTNQLHERIRRDPRVVVHEQTDMRALGAVHVASEPVDIVVGDLSFISVRSALPLLLNDELTKPDVIGLLLVKPQFEVGREVVARSQGVLTDPSAWADALRLVADRATELNLVVTAGCPSSIRGAEGNAEFFYLLRRASAWAHEVPRIRDLIAEMVAEAGEHGRD